MNVVAIRNAVNAKFLLDYFKVNANRIFHSNNSFSLVKSGVLKIILKIDNSSNTYSPRNLLYLRRPGRWCAGIRYCSSLSQGELPPEAVCIRYACLICITQVQLGLQAQQTIQDQQSFGKIRHESPNPGKVKILCWVSSYLIYFRE